MYNKLFTKILDSSIWMEDTPTRLVWITFLAVMDEEGMCMFASIANLAHRARVTLAEAEAAVACLIGADEHSSDPDNDGRRIERVPGGWVVLNAEKYRRLVTREVAREKTRERVARHREKKRGETHGSGEETACNADVTEEKREVTPSEAVTESEAEPTAPSGLSAGRGGKESKGITEGKGGDLLPTSPQSKRFAALFHRRLTTAWTKGEVEAYRAIGTVPEEDMAALEAYYQSNWPPDKEKNILRHDLITLLNNFPGEVGRAHMAKATKNTSNGPRSIPKPQTVYVEDDE